MRTLILIRHGQTDWNRQGRYQGQTDIPLNSAGAEEAQALRARLSKYDHLYDPAHTAVISSDLSRALDTARIALECTGREIFIDEKLRESRYGAFEGLPRSEIRRRYPQAFVEWHYGSEDFVLDEGGESRAMVKQRVFQAIDHWLGALTHDCLIFVTHGGIIRQIMQQVSEMNPPLALSSQRLNYANTCAHQFHWHQQMIHYVGEVD